MRKRLLLFMMIVLAGGFAFFPSDKEAQAKKVYTQEKPDDPAIKASFTADGKTYESDNVADVWRRVSGKSNAVFKLYADWDIREPIEIGGSYNKLTIDLNGHRLRRITDGRSRNGCIIRINGGELTIKDLPSSQGIGKGGVLTGGNSKNSAGGIHINGGKLIMNGGSVNGNATDDDGGAISIEGGGSATLVGACFNNNYADDSGGAIYLKNGSLTAKNCVFDRNKADDNGGAIAVNSDNVKLINVIMQNNFADDDGGALWVNDKKVYLSGGLIKYNMADYGGGVYVDSRYDINIQGKLIIQDNHTTSNDVSNLCLQDGALSSAKIYSGGLLHGSMVGVNKTRSLSSSGYTAVVETSVFQEKTCFKADRGKLVMPKGKTEKVIYMATAIGDAKFGPLIAVALVLLAVVTLIIVSLRRKKAMSTEADGEEESL